ncbi:Crp/Fnr family transcriptional regulator [Tenacibaculum xiamenense]|uniref:Crp/Fnr family transcriptional regulator n=1 Tax=Tenacibaculum xiamenense TaxID=1261553 RepID=UPI003893945C
MFQQKKSKYNIESIEEVDAFAISINELEKIFKTEPKFERFGRLFMQQLFVELVERVDDLQLHSAKERYQTLLSKKPHLFLRVPSKYIASFLGMTPETLSRMRGKS